MGDTRGARVAWFGGVNRRHAHVELSGRLAGQVYLGDPRERSEEVQLPEGGFGGGADTQHSSRHRTRLSDCFGTRRAAKEHTVCRSLFARAASQPRSGELAAMHGRRKRRLGQRTQGRVMPATTGDGAATPLSGCDHTAVAITAAAKT